MDEKRDAEAGDGLRDAHRRCKSVGCPGTRRAQVSDAPNQIDDQTAVAIRSEARSSDSTVR